MSLIDRDKGGAILPEKVNKEKVVLPTENELRSKKLKELLEFRGEFEEKLDYLRKHNAPDNEIVQANEEYHYLLEQIIKDKMQEESKE